MTRLDELFKKQDASRKIKWEKLNGKRTNKLLKFTQFKSYSALQSPLPIYSYYKYIWTKWLHSILKKEFLLLLNRKWGI